MFPFPFLSVTGNRQKNLPFDKHVDGVSFKFGRSSVYCTCAAGDSGVSPLEDSAGAEDVEETSSASSSPTTSCSSAW